MGRHAECNKDCLNCKLAMCIYDLKDAKQVLQESVDKYDKARHAIYYLKHKAEIDAKQREYDRKNRKAEYLHEYYLRHKEAINKKNREQYAQNREERNAQAKAYYYEHRDEISKKRKAKYQEKKEAEYDQKHGN